MVKNAKPWTSCRGRTWHIIEEGKRGREAPSVLKNVWKRPHYSGTRPLPSSLAARFKKGTAGHIISDCWTRRFLLDSLSFGLLDTTRGRLPWGNPLFLRDGLDNSRQTLGRAKAQRGPRCRADGANGETRLAQ